MTLAFGDYEQSYPPEVLRGYAPPLVAGAAARSAPPHEEGDTMEPTTPPPDPGPESNAPEGAVPVESTSAPTEGVAVVAVPLDQLDEAAAEAEPTPTVRAASAAEVDAGELVGDELAEQDAGDTVTEQGDGDGDRSATEQALEASAPDEVADEAPRFEVSAGTPGSYDPDVSAKDRPRNVTELRALAVPAPGNRAPWLEGEYVLVGTTGKRAHWSGSDWHGDESPGYESAPE